MVIGIHVQEVHVVYMQVGGNRYTCQEVHVVYMQVGGNRYTCTGGTCGVHAGGW